MLVFVDALADAVLLAVDAALLSFGQVAVVFRHVTLLAILNRGLAIFEIRGLASVELAVFHAITDALLLIFFAVVDFIHTRVTGIDDAGTCARGG